MSFMQVILEFFASTFPYWGVCNFHFEPETKTMYIQCRTPEKRARILEDARRISDLDIGIKQFIITDSEYSNIILSKFQAI